MGLTIRHVLAGTVPFFQALPRSIDRNSRFFIQLDSIARTTVFKRLPVSKGIVTMNSSPMTISAKSDTKGAAKQVMTFFYYFLENTPILGGIY